MIEKPVEKKEEAKRENQGKIKAQRKVGGIHRRGSKAQETKTRRVRTVCSFSGA